MEAVRKALSASVTENNSQSNTDRASQLAAARQRAVEVRKQRAEEKRELKMREKENEKLRLQKVKMENERLKNEISTASDDGNDSDTEAKPKKALGKVKAKKPKNVINPLPSTSTGERAEKADTKTEKKEEKGTNLVEGSEKVQISHATPPDFGPVAEKIEKLTSMFEEEMQYKKRKREEKEKEASRMHESNRSRQLQMVHDPAYVAYHNGMKKMRESALMTHVFGH